jgi:hypothetical protein
MPTWSRKTYFLQGCHDFIHAKFIPDVTICSSTVHAVVRIKSDIQFRSKTSVKKAQCVRRSKLIYPLAQ